MAWKGAKIHVGETSVFCRYRVGAKGGDQC